MKQLAKNFALHALALLNWVRWGRLREEVRDRIDWIVTEVAYIDRYGHVVGYWGYGSFDPEGAYRGQPFTFFEKAK